MLRNSFPFCAVKEDGVWVKTTIEEASKKRAEFGPAYSLELHAVDVVHKKWLSMSELFKCDGYKAVLFAATDTVDAFLIISDALSVMDLYNEYHRQPSMFLPLD